MLNLVLKGNCFRFDHDYYLQINGTAMGTRVAPTYAIIFMNYFEEKYVYKYHKSPRIWFRFIGDIWGIFRGSTTEFLEFVQHLNNVHSSIKFTAEYSKTEVVFLDVVTRVNHDHSIITTLYTKPTDNHGYLDFSSCHPYHNKSSIPYSQFLRIRRNCTLWQDFVINSMKLVTYLSLRGYPYRLIQGALLRVNKLTQSQVLNHKVLTEENNKNLVCVLDHNPFNPDLREIIQDHWKIMERSSSTRPLSEISITFAYRRPKNLMDILCRSDIRLESCDPLKLKNRTPLCPNILKCSHCAKLDKSGKVISFSTGRKYKCIKKCTCRSTNLIYCIECLICHKQYVGQTKNQLRIRMNNHLSSIRNNGDTPVARHFAHHEKINNPPFKTFVLQLIRSVDNDSDQHSRNMWEDTWMARLYTIVPKGLNIQD